MARTVTDEVEFSLELELRYDAKTGIVEGRESVLQGGPGGEVVSKEDLSLRYILIGEADFREQVRDAGFSVCALFGDYDRSRFVPEVSPFMIWTLEK